VSGDSSRSWVAGRAGIPLVAFGTRQTRVAALPVHARVSLRSLPAGIALRPFGARGRWNNQGGGLAVRAEREQACGLRRPRGLEAVQLARVLGKECDLDCTYRCLASLARADDSEGEGHKAECDCERLPHQ